uniref:U3 small nucleolar RNA-associated protein 6 n=1 Tax=Panagrolaimus sp. ES5 TaxID=591445 RepID=A0AC34GXL0_9BILA
MAEFVQRHLEELLPAFTGLQRTKILSDEEVKTLIQKVRQFEYCVNKRTKRPKDFLKYAEYLSDLLELIDIRRKALGNKNKRNEIEKPLKFHAAHLLRICSERFKKAEYYQKEIEFLDKNALFHILTKTYTRFLRLHGTNPRNHEEAGRWEFFKNKSAENARVIFQFAVRKFPKDIALWVAFVEMEIAYVVMLAERRARLTSADGKVVEDENETLVAWEDGISDEVFQFKLVEIVLNQGLANVDDKKELLNECYKIAHKYDKPAEKVAEMIASLLWPNK